MLVSAAYTLDPTNHVYFTDITPSSVLTGRVTLTSKTTVAGAANAANITFSAVAAGLNVAAIVLFKSTGTDATSPLIAYLGNATGLPITGNGGDIIVVWDSGTNKIFRV